MILSPFIFTLLTLVGYVLASSTIDYVNEKPIMINGTMFQLLGVFPGDYGSGQDMRNISAPQLDSITINAAGYTYLASILVNNDNTTSPYKRENAVINMLGGLLENTGLYVDPESVLQASDTDYNATGSLNVSEPQVERRFFVSTSIACMSAYGYVIDQVEAGKGKIKKSLNWKNLETCWNLTKDMLSTPANIAMLSQWLGVNVKGISTKNTCSSFVFARYDIQHVGNNDHIWIITGSSWTTGINCDTTASASDIGNALQDTIQDEVNRKMGAACTRLDNDGTWKTDVRFMIASLVASCNLNIWDQPCIS